MNLKVKNVAAFIFFVLLLMGMVFISRSSVDSSSESTDLESEVFLALVINTKVTRPVNSPFGVQIYGSSESSSKYYADIDESRASWIRNMVFWATVESKNTTPDNYNWAYSDRLFAAAGESDGFNMIGNIETNPTWASTVKRGVINKVPMSEFAEFVGAMVERYDADGFKDAPGSPRVTHWELYNEPDRAESWGDHPKEYAEMLEAVYPAVKAASAEAQVVFGGIAHDGFTEQGGPFVRNFTEEVLKNGGGPNFDVMNIHTYPVFNLRWANSGIGLIEKVDAVRGILAKYVQGSKPMIITEAGWHSDSPPGFPSNQKLQSEMLVKLFAQSIAADVKIMIWWMLYDSGDHNFDNGLVTNGSPPVRKQSFYTYQNMASKLESANFHGLQKTSASAGQQFVIELYPFTKTDGQQVYIIYRSPVGTNNDNGQTVHQRLAHSKVTLRDITTDAVIKVIVDSDADGHVDVPATARPVYVEVG